MTQTFLQHKLAQLEEHLGLKPTVGCSTMLRSGLA
jgi:hypothetical protein